MRAAAWSFVAWKRGWNTSSAFPGGESLDCPVDYFENDRLLRQEIKERSAAI